MWRTRYQMLRPDEYLIVLERKDYLLTLITALLCERRRELKSITTSMIVQSTYSRKRPDGRFWGALSTHGR